MKTGGRETDLATLRRSYGEYRFYVLPVAIITVVMLLTMVVVIPGIKQGWETLGQLRQKREKLALMRTKLAGLLEMDEVELEQRVEVVEAVLPSGKDVGRFLAAIRGVAIDSGVGLVGVDMSPGELEGREVKKGEDKREVVISVSLVGSLEAVGQFLEGVGRMIPVMTAYDVLLTREGDVVQAKIGLTAHYWVAPSSLGPVDKPVGSLSGGEEELYQELATRILGGGQDLGLEAEEAPVGNPDLIQ
ncbi:MAG: type 4a pilus biogenesis protein PilO [Candidatus Chisholmbacteria bacterium]|nr:type 4a pilus biogenesis protein PilO [Candidatus Chisholmbacteria bacterium]